MERLPPGRCSLLWAWEDLSGMTWASGTREMMSTQGTTGSAAKEQTDAGWVSVKGAQCAVDVHFI